jgi:hypothetical protein
MPSIMSVKPTTSKATDKSKSRNGVLVFETTSGVRVGNHPQTTALLSKAPAMKTINPRPIRGPEKNSVSLDSV